MKIDKWNLRSQYPDGHFVRSIGPIGSIEVNIYNNYYSLFISDSVFFCNYASKMFDMII